ncbi:MAG TPA: DUF4397 domain-containing protein [Streptosporangiaceae bacterium]|jgi:hypothetical protein
MKAKKLTRRTLAMIGLLALGLGVAVAGTARASEGSGSGTGWIRLAHLSPNTPAVDVYLYSFGNSNAMIVLHHVSYGTVSQYQEVAAGDYSVAMRPAGAAASTEAVLSASVDIAPGHAYTVAGMGPESGLRLAVLDDELTTPSGQALVRVIEASLKQRVATVTFDGSMIAHKVTFGSVSSYQAVPPGTGSVAVTDGSGHVSSQVALKADTVHTLVVLDGTNGLETVNLLDAAGNTDDPVGGVATGFGGTAPHGPSSPVPWLAAIVAGLALATVAALRLRRPSRRPISQG